MKKLSRTVISITYSSTDLNHMNDVKIPMLLVFVQIENRNIAILVNLTYKVFLYDIGNNVIRQ